MLSTGGPSNSTGFLALNRPKTDALYSIDQLGSHPERWATAPVQELAELLAFHSASLVHQRFADVYAVPLRQLHDLFERRATAEERLRCLQAVADAVDRMSRTPDLRDAGAALSRFLYDPDLLIATTAALNLAALYAPQVDAPMSGVTSVAGMASRGLNHRRRAAWLAGLVCAWRRQGAECRGRLLEAALTRRLERAGTKRNRVRGPRRPSSSSSCGGRRQLLAILKANGVSGRHSPDSSTLPKPRVAPMRTETKSVSSRSTARYPRGRAPSTR